MTAELGSVRGDRRKEVLERQAVTELEQEKALHQLAVERANRACERADAAEAEVERLRAKVEYWKGRRDAAADVRGLNAAKERAETAEAERDAAREALARVEAAANEIERTANECERLSHVRAGLSVEADLRTAALVNRKRAEQIRAALAQPETDDGAGK